MDMTDEFPKGSLNSGYYRDPGHKSSPMTNEWAKRIAEKDREIEELRSLIELSKKGNALKKYKEIQEENTDLKAQLDAETKQGKTLFFVGRSGGKTAAMVQELAEKLSKEALEEKDRQIADLEAKLAAEKQRADKAEALINATIKANGWQLAKEAKDAKPLISGLDVLDSLSGLIDY